MKEINIYIEGGGNDNSQARSKLRECFGDFLVELVDIARQNGFRWKLVACGSRNDAYDDFLYGLRSKPQVIHCLLVDSEGPISAGSPIWPYLKQRDRWECPDGINDDRCFLMAQSMETWLVADRASLARFYGQGFNPNPLPAVTRNIETVDKDELLSALKTATAKAEPKGRYHKTQHGFDILAKSDPKVVRRAASHCKRLFVTLSRAIGGEIEDE
ncbi:MAG: DUF4276 family protein [Capsulimonadaceae bacterium]